MYWAKRRTHRYRKVADDPSRKWQRGPESRTPSPVSYEPRNERALGRPATDANIHEPTTPQGAVRMLQTDLILTGEGLAVEGQFGPFIVGGDVWSDPRSVG